MSSQIEKIRRSTRRYKNLAKKSGASPKFRAKTMSLRPEDDSRIGLHNFHEFY